VLSPLLCSFSYLGGACHAHDDDGHKCIHLNDVHAHTHKHHKNKFYIHAYLYTLCIDLECVQHLETMQESIQNGVLLSAGVRHESQVRVVSKGDIAWLPTKDTIKSPQWDKNHFRHPGNSAQTIGSGDAHHGGSITTSIKGEGGLQSYVGVWKEI